MAEATRTRSQTQTPITVANGIVPPAGKEGKDVKFRRLANVRVPKALKALENVGNLGNRLVYAYTDEQRTKLFDAFDNAVKSLKARFAADAKPETTAVMF